MDCARTRCDRREELTDRHMIFLIQDPVDTGVNHAVFFGCRNDAVGNVVEQWSAADGLSSAGASNTFDIAELIGAQMGPLALMVAG